MCGLVGISGTPDAARLAVLALQRLQHRGQEAVGVISYEGVRGETFHGVRELGLVGDVFSADEESGIARLARLRGTSAIGHVRYSTHGPKEKTTRNVQPLYVETTLGGFAIVHNGNITNASSLRDSLTASGSIFQSATDTEVICHLVARSKHTVYTERLVEALEKVSGAYSLVVLTDTELVGIRDPHGFWPLILGKKETENGTVHILSSETCAFGLLGAVFVRNIEPGEMIVISSYGIVSSFPFEPSPKHSCIFELVYFSRPDSLTEENRAIYETRIRIGAQLAKEKPVEADIVVPVPASGNVAALGFSEECTIPFSLAIVRDHYVGRTFIEPEQPIRNLGVLLKHNVTPGILRGKRVVLVDDSIVRGTTMRKLVAMVREQGEASEVHIRIASPPTTHSCFYGIDTPNRNELIAAQKSREKIRNYIKADSLEYLSLGGLHKAVGGSGYCDACFSGNYPTPIEGY